MQEFFRGWKRKLGIVTLMMACLMLAALLRSSNRFESLQLNVAGIQPILISGNQKIWLTFQRRQIVLSFKSFKLPQQDIGFGSSLFFTSVDNTPDCERIVRWNQIGSGTFYEGPFLASGPRVVLDGTVAENQLAAIPYWSIVIPLTLLSGYLLLSKPSFLRNTTGHTTKGEPSRVSSRIL